MKKLIILIYGLPGSGKTTLAQALHDRLQCIWLNADEVRQTLSRDLSFSEEDRIEQARRLGAMANLALRHSKERFCLVDFVNPTVPTYDAFLRFGGNVARLVTERAVPRSLLHETESLEVFSVYMDTISKEDCRFEDTAAMFEASRLTRPDLRILQWDAPEAMARKVFEALAAKGIPEVPAH
jgi:adenylate kinase family enzyme